MDLGFLNAKDWTDFENAFPRAYAFLAARTNLREHEALLRRRRYEKLDPYAQKRLDDLALVFGEKEKSDGN
jgi:hypothetical protein